MPQTVFELEAFTTFNHSETKTHLVRVQELTRDLIEAYDQQKGSILSKEYKESVVKSSVLHDIGKMTISKEILDKKGPLSETERYIIETHPITGSYILKKMFEELSHFYSEEELKIAKNIVVGHHERWNGCGYPYGLEKENIPLEARIVAVVDVFDALTHERCYKRAWTKEEAIALLNEKKEIDFDPDLVDCFVALQEG